jgi:hypothetical protein
MLVQMSTVKDMLFNEKQNFSGKYTGPEWQDLHEELQSIYSRYCGWLKRVEALKTKTEEEKKQVNVKMTYKEAQEVVSILDFAAKKTPIDYPKDSEKIRDIIAKIQSAEDYLKHYNGT